MIKKVEVFETMGKQFPSAKKAIEHRENLIEKFIRETPGFYDLSHGNRGKFVEHIIAYRDELITLLSYADNIED